MTAANFRRIALGLPEAVEGTHFGNADFRVGGKIFATLALESEGYGVLLLTPEEQAGMVEDEPKIFSPVPGGWGRKGSTRVLLAEVARFANVRTAGRQGRFRYVFMDAAMQMGIAAAAQMIAGERASGDIDAIGRSTQVIEAAALTA